MTKTKATSEYYRDKVAVVTGYSATIWLGSLSFGSFYADAMRQEFF